MPTSDPYLANPADDVERLAMGAVSRWVGSRGDVIDQSAGHDPDFAIRYHDGRTAIGDVTSHADPTVEAMWKAAYKHPDHQLVPLGHGQGRWSVRLVYGAHVGALYRELPGLIASLNTAGIRFVQPAYLPPSDPVAESVTALGIDYLVRADDNEPARAMFFIGPWVSAVDLVEPDGIVDWVEDVLGSPAYGDMSAKLLRQHADERHIYVMAGSATPAPVENRLQRINESLPTRAPSLAVGISHVWVASQFVDKTRGAWVGVWSAVDGWASTPLPLTRR